MLLGFLAFQAPSRAGLAVGDAVSPAILEKSGATSLPDTAGKVFLVDFWASWCASCKASFPAYGRLNADLSPLGLVIIAVGVDEDAAAFDGFVRKLNPTFFVLRDRGQAIVRTFDVPTMPTCYLVDRSGRIRFVHQGFRGADTEKALGAEIRSLLAEKAP